MTLDISIEAVCTTVYVPELMLLCVHCYLRHCHDIKIELPQGNEYQKLLKTTNKVFP